MCQVSRDNTWSCRQSEASGQIMPRCFRVLRGKHGSFMPASILVHRTQKHSPASEKDGTRQGLPSFWLAGERRVKWQKSVRHLFFHPFYWIPKPSKPLSIAKRSISSWVGYRNSWNPSVFRNETTRVSQFIQIAQSTFSFTSSIILAVACGDVRTDGI